MNLRLRFKLFKEYFLFLLPLFFVFHGYNDNYGLVLFPDVMKLIVLYILSAFVLSFLLFLFFHSWRKASLYIFFLLCFYFFFGAVHDTLKHFLPDFFLAKYIFIIPAVLVTFVLYLIFLKRSKRKFSSLVLYLNVMLLLLLVFEIVRFGTKSTEFNQRSTDIQFPFTACDTCQTPDVYLILADEYPGKKTLADIFSFDNSPFERELEQRGFQLVPHSISNYNWTPFSMASMLNMNYLRLTTTEVTIPGILASEDEIKKSPVIQFFQRAGYTIYNNSIFTIGNKPSPLYPVFVGARKSLLTASTFTERFKKDLGFHFMTEAEMENIKKKYLFNNIKADSLTRSIAATRSNEKKFIYTHLMLPHHPYFFDSTGKMAPPEALEDDYKLNKPAFISYLLYSNKKLLSLIDHIKTVSEREPVIVLMSDHGFRQFTDSTTNNYHFINLNAVLLPGKKEAGFYEGMSNVNEFRLLLNTQFGQHLPLLKDSSIFLWEK